MNDFSFLQKEIIENFYAHIGEATKTLTADDKDKIKAIAKDAAQLTLKSLKGEKVDVEIKIVNATLANMAIAKYFPIRNLFWASVERVGVVLLSTITKAAISAVITAV